VLRGIEHDGLRFVHHRPAASRNETVAKAHFAPGDFVERPCRALEVRGVLFPWEPHAWAAVHVELDAQVAAPKTLAVVDVSQGKIFCSQRQLIAGRFRCELDAPRAPVGHGQRRSVLEKPVLGPLHADHPFRQDLEARLAEANGRFARAGGVVVGIHGVHAP